MRVQAAWAMPGLTFQLARASSPQKGDSHMRIRNLLTVLPALALSATLVQPVMAATHHKHHAHHCNCKHYKGKKHHHKHHHHTAKPKKAT
jgi:hypothetical protein